MIDKEIVREALKTVKYPGFSRDIVSFGLVNDISVDGSAVSVRLQVTTADETVPLKIKTSVEEVLKVMEEIDQVTVEVSLQKQSVVLVLGKHGRDVVHVVHGRGGTLQTLQWCGGGLCHGRGDRQSTGQSDQETKQDLTCPDFLDEHDPPAFSMRNSSPVLSELPPVRSHSEVNRITLPSSETSG